MNQVGVNLNQASEALLSYVSGITKNTAKEIVQQRDKEGAFKSREDLRKVKGFGPKTFEQAAGFLRLADAENPLDKSAVHPERYALVETIAKDLGISVADLVGNVDKIRQIDVAKYVSEEVGLPTLKDILSELEKPAPRSSRRVRLRELRREGQQDLRSPGGHAARGCRHQRHQLRRLHRTSASTKTASSTSRRSPTAS